MQVIKQYIEDNKQRLLDELFELLRFPSVSADPKYKPDVLNAADYVAKKLIDAGAEQGRSLPNCRLSYRLRRKDH
jgi:acetylornithine deacetylase/succinyl-diaminopimelate desuccinylase-like protein